MLPWLAREARGSVGRGVELALKAMNAFLVPIGLGFVLFAEPLIDTLYGSAFEGSVLPLQLLGFTSVLYGVQALAGTTFIARDAPAAFAWLVGPVVLVNLLVNLVLIPRYGADGAAATALASSLLLAVLSLVFVQRRVGRLRLVHAFAGPVVAGAVMALAAVALPGPALLRAVVAVVAYAVALGAFELTAFRADTTVLLAALPPQVRNRLRLT
jgi:O-antigen/teichoic acid export membrane protein